MTARTSLRALLLIALASVPALMARADAIADDDRVIVLTPAEQADFAGVRAFMLDSSRAADPRLRTFVAMSQQFIDATTLPAARRVPVDTLAEQARGSTDPLVLSLLIELCANDRLKPQPTCDPVALARQWTVADTQNQVAWLTLASTLRSGHDEDGARAAFERGAQASTWHESYDDGGRVVSAAIPKNLGPRARMALQYQAMTASAAWLVPTSAVSELSFRCKDAALREACRRIVDTIDRDGGSLLSRQMAVSIGWRDHVDDDATGRRARALEALSFASTLSTLKTWTEIVDPAELAVQASRWDRRVALGEIAWAKEVLEAGGAEMAAGADRFHRDHLARRARLDADERARAATR